MARKAYFDDPVWMEKIDRLVDLLRKGVHVETACKKIGLTKKTYYKWLEEARNGTSERHIEFARRVDEANADFEINVIDEIYKIGKTERVWTALAWLAERRFSDRYAPPGQQIKVVQEVSNQLEAIMKEAERILDPASYARLVNHLEAGAEDKEDLVGEASKFDDGAQVDSEVDAETLARLKTFHTEQ